MARSATKPSPLLALTLCALVMSCEDEPRTPPKAAPTASAVVKPQLDAGTLAYKDGKITRVRPLEDVTEHLSFEVQTAWGTTRCTLVDALVKCGLGGRSAVARSAEAPVWWLRTGVELPYDHRERTGAKRLLHWSSKKRQVDSFQDAHRGSFVMADGTLLVLAKDLFTETHELWRIGRDSTAAAIPIPKSAQSKDARPRLIGRWLLWTTLGERHPKQVDVLVADAGAEEVSETLVGSNISGLEATRWCRHESGIRVVFASVDGPSVLIQTGTSWKLIGAGNEHAWPKGDSTHLTCTSDGVWLTAGQHEESTYDLSHLKCDGSGCIRGLNRLLLRPSPDFPTVPPVAAGKRILMLSTTEGESGVRMLSSVVGELGKAKATHLLSGEGVAVRRVMAHGDRALAIVQVREDRWGALIIDGDGTVVDGMRVATRARPPKLRGDHGHRGTLAREKIDEVVQGQQPHFQSCYETSLRDNPALAGSLKVQFAVGRDGSMANATASGEVFDARLHSCIVRAFYAMSFPQPQGGIVTPTCNFVLRRVEGAPKVSVACPDAQK